MQYITRLDISKYKSSNVFTGNLNKEQRLPVYDTTTNEVADI